MKRRQILEAEIRKPKRKREKQITVQKHAGYLVLDVWNGDVCKMRHAMDVGTGEYATYYFDTGKWTGDSLKNAVGCGGYWGTGVNEKEYYLAEEDKTLIRSATKETWNDRIYHRIERQEESYSCSRRYEKRCRRETRIAELMNLCAKPGPAVREWLADIHTAGQHYAFWDKEEKAYRCTACRRSFPPPKEKVRHKDSLVCPECGRRLTAIRRGNEVCVKTHLTLIHNLTEKMGVERFFRAEICWSGESGREVILEEDIRLTLLRKGKSICKIYYDDGWGGWSEGNRTNRRWKTSYLYPDAEGIREGLQGTAYERWMDVLPQLAQAGAEANYNGLLAGGGLMARTAEYLLKGRFYRLLKEESERISYYYGYEGDLNLRGETIEEVMGLGDRQKINRLRQENGGGNMLEWLKWTEESGKKISGECMQFLEKEKISRESYENSEVGKHLTPEQLMHYLTRQQAESYQGKTAKAVFEQYEDYLAMAKRLGKHMDDEMVYRPRELKRRHDEASEECRLRREELLRMADREKAEKQAEEMRQKYPSYEEILEEVRRKYEYEDEEYLIRVPKDFGEITAEGMALHHCVGNTERYFDRIVSRETYICFLRQQSSRDTPYYTIEVEPGGTIRQHRGMYDEEPEIEKIKPFLRRWQQEIRRRMGTKDHEYAQKSAVLRQKNIEELMEKKNTRVLNGLMEDLMEVV